MTVAHGAGLGYSACEVEFLRSSDTGKLSDILGGHTCSRHDDDPISCLLDQLSDDLCPFKRRSLAPRGKDTGTARLDDILKSCRRITAHIDSSMESHGEISRSLDEATKEGLIYLTVGSQTADYDTIDTELTSHLDVLKHGFNLNRCVEEVPCSGADDHIELDIDSTACSDDLSV